MSEDAARREAIIRAFTPREPDEQIPEPPIEGLPPRDKPSHEYTAAEWAATRENTLRILRERERDAEDARRREAEQADRTDDQLLADSIPQLTAPDAKRERDAALVRALYPEETEE